MLPLEGRERLADLTYRSYTRLTPSAGVAGWVIRCERWLGVSWLLVSNAQPTVTVISRKMVGRG